MSSYLLAKLKSNYESSSLIWFVLLLASAFGLGFSANSGVYNALGYKRYSEIQIQELKGESGETVQTLERQLKQSHGREKALSGENQELVNQIIVLEKQKETYEAQLAPLKNLSLGRAWNEVVIGFIQQSAAQNLHTLRSAPNMIMLNLQRQLQDCQRSRGNCQRIQKEVQRYHEEQQIALKPYRALLHTATRKLEEYNAKINRAVALEADLALEKDVVDILRLGMFMDDLPGKEVSITATLTSLDRTIDQERKMRLDSMHLIKDVWFSFEDLNIPSSDLHGLTFSVFVEGYNSDNTIEVIPSIEAILGQGSSIILKPFGIASKRLVIAGGEQTNISVFKH